MVKVNPSLKQSSQEIHRKISFRTVVQRFTVNLQPSFTKKEKSNTLYGSRMKKLCAISSISFRKGSLVTHCTMVMHRKGLSL